MTVEPIGADELVFGTTALRRTAHAELALPPDDLILSVRCIVRVDDKFVVCTNVDGASHPWPGGRREAGESYAETARREVHEETGWLIDVDSMQHLGWLHYEHLAPMTQPEYPWPDFFQIVFVATATNRAGDDSWTDTEGYEASSRLKSFADTYASIDGDALARVFLDRLA
jgi:ADP-ribose pyrophosphatase YjhB (NUDIX family)